jgi:hypothetical protein
MRQYGKRKAQATPTVKRVFEKYKIGLTNPRGSPPAPLEKATLYIHLSIETKTLEIP